MGYACPVCSDPQSDAGHLANHLAFTAMLRGGDHEEWLDAEVPEWEGLSEEALAERVVPLAEETEYPQVFEDTTEGHDHADGAQEHRRRATDSLPPGADALADADFEGEHEEILEEARELTRKRRGDEETEGE